MQVTQIVMFGEPRLKRLAESQTPVYRITHLGPQACSYQELLAALIGGETQLEVAEAIAARWKTPPELISAPLAEIGNIHGMGPARAARLMAAFELGRLAAVMALGEHPAIHSPADAAALVQYEMSALEQISEKLLEEKRSLTEHIGQFTKTDDQLAYIEEFCAKIRDGLDHADFDAKRQIIEMLDVHCKIDFNDGEKVIWLKCLIEPEEQPQLLRIQTSPLSSTGATANPRRASLPTARSR